MNKLVIRLPPDTRSKLELAFTEGHGFERVELDIVLVLDDGSMSVRELSAYLELADRVYGRTFEKGLISYALQPVAQLRISEVRKGSTEFIIADSVLNFVRDTGSSMIALYLFLKYGPAGLKTLSEAVKNIADARKSYWDVELIKASVEKTHQEAKLAKANRRKIIEEMKMDPLLRDLDEKERAQIRRFLKESEKSEHHLIPSARRFAAHSVKDIVIRLRKKASRSR